MKQVYVSSSQAEAHMLVHFLEAHDIKAFIHGEALQGALGEVPMMGNLSVNVIDEHYEVARELIREFEAKQPKEQPKTTEVVYVTKYMTLKNLISHIVFFVVLHLYLTGFASQSEYDYNGDGNMDAVITYELNGHRKELKEDLNFDGFFETKWTYVNDQGVSSQIDLNKDGHKDIECFFEFNVVQHCYYYDHNTHKLIKIAESKDLLLAYETIDLDQDGNFDIKHFFDEYENIIKTEKLN